MDGGSIVRLNGRRVKLIEEHDHLEAGDRTRAALQSAEKARSDEDSWQPPEEGSTVYSAWKRRHDLAENACPECQGSTFVPGPMYEERMVDECPECKGTGKDAMKKAA
jgi:hypothetical protein